MIFRLCSIIILNVQLALAKYSNLDQEQEYSETSGEGLIWLIIFLIVGGYAIEIYKKTVKETIQKDIAKKYLWYIPALVLVIAILPLKTEFYEFVRTVIFIFAFYIAYKNYSIGNKNMTYIFIGIGIIFNIFIPIYLPKVIWIIIDVCVIYLLVSNANSFTKREKLKEATEEKEYFENEDNDYEKEEIEENSKKDINEIANNFIKKSKPTALNKVSIEQIKIFYRKNYLSDIDELEIYDLNNLIPIDEPSDKEYKEILIEVKKSLITE
jgi:hypothetical protein